MTDYEIETALANWCDGQDIVDVESDLDDFMSNVIDAVGDVSDDERPHVEAFARNWLEAHVEDGDAR
jgi:hypothetical protein